MARGQTGLACQDARNAARRRYFGRLEARPAGPVGQATGRSGRRSAQARCPVQEPHRLHRHRHTIRAVLLPRHGPSLAEMEREADRRAHPRRAEVAKQLGRKVTAPTLAGRFLAFVTFLRQRRASGGRVESEPHQPGTISSRRVRLLVGGEVVMACTPRRWATAKRCTSSRTNFVISGRPAEQHPRFRRRSRPGSATCACRDQDGSAGSATPIRAGRCVWDENCVADACGPRRAFTRSPLCSADR